ncbi:MAG: hypothetical protein M3159_09595 [Actinomycetota bacterium]|nr:hypothetical protein [Actinomycetota bacterium]
MPTFAWLPRFRADFRRLTPGQQAALLVAVAQFVDDLRPGGQFRKGLRVKGIKGAPGTIEMTWAPDGGATFQYGESVRVGEPHIIWRRVGTHSVFREP